MKTKCSRPGEALAQVNPVVPDGRCFSGFDAYQKLLALSEVNYVLHATPPGFRPNHLRAIVEAGKHCFVEMPVAVDPIGVALVLESGERAAKKHLTLACGCQRRHQANYQETVKRLQDGAIGEILAARVYGNASGRGNLNKPAGLTEIEWQLRHWRDSRGSPGIPTSNNMSTAWMWLIGSSRPLPSELPAWGAVRCAP